MRSRTSLLVRSKFLCTGFADVQLPCPATARSCTYGWEGKRAEEIVVACLLLWYLLHMTMRATHTPCQQCAAALHYQPLPCGHTSPAVHFSVLLAKGSTLIGVVVCYMLSLTAHRALCTCAAAQGAADHVLQAIQDHVHVPVRNAGACVRRVSVAWLQHLYV